MNKYLYKILESFSDTEWKRFEDFARSPFFVKGRNYSKILSLIRKNILNKEGYANLNLDFFNKHLAEHINKNTLNNRLSELNKLAMQFLNYLNTEKDKTSFYAGIYEEFYGRKLFSNMQYLNTQVFPGLQPESVFDYPAYLRILKSKGFYLRNVNDMDRYREQFRNYSNYFTVHALFFIISTAFDQIGFGGYKFTEMHQRFVKVYKSLNFEALIPEIENDSLYRDAILMYYIMNTLENDLDANLYTKAYEYFADNYASFSNIMKEDFYLKLQSLCVHGISKGNESYYEYYLDIVKHKQKHNYPIITEHNQKAFSEFHDIVNLALQCDELDWAEKFINENVPKLNENFREVDRINSLTGLYIKRKDYLKALSISKELKSTENRFYTLEMHTHRIVINYELGLHEEAEKSLNNMNKFIKNNSRIHPPLFERFEIFAKNAGRLMNLRFKPQRKAEEFYKYISTLDISYPKNQWLIDKAEKLMVQ